MESDIRERWRLSLQRQWRIARARFTLSLLALATTLPLRAQIAAFTYQGRLGDGGQPVNGYYDFQFRLSDAATAGNYLGPTLTRSFVSVSGGLFVVGLDFGAAVFDGSPRWLEIAVRTNTAPAFTVLAPRQPVTATPYALFSSNAAGLSGQLPVSQLTGVLTPAQLPAGVLTNGAAGVNLSGAFTGSVVSQNLIGNGAGITNLWQTYSNDLAMLRPEAFGAVGDDATDDSAAVQAALNASASPALRGKSYVFLHPAKAYFINQPITLSSNMVLVGLGKSYAMDVGGYSTFYNFRFSAAAGSCFKANRQRLSGTRFIGLGIQGPGVTGGNTRAFDLDYMQTNPNDLYGGQGVAIEECNVFDCDYALVVSGIDNLRVNGLITGNIGTGMWFKKGPGPTFFGVMQAMYIFNFTACKVHGPSVKIEWGDAYEFKSCDLYHVDYPGINLEVHGQGGAMVDFSGNMEGGNPQVLCDNGWVHLHNGRYEKAPGPGIVLTNGGNVQIDFDAMLATDPNTTIGPSQVAVKSWNLNVLEGVYSASPILVSNAVLGQMFFSSPFPRSYAWYDEFPQWWPGQVRQFNVGNPNVSPNTYAWMGHSIQPPGLGPFWANWDEYTTEWDRSNSVVKPNTSLTVKSLSGDGSGVTGLNGANVQPGTLTSNAIVSVDASQVFGLAGSVTSWTSPELDISGGAASAAHPLGTVPRFVRVVLRCKADDSSSGIKAGEEVALESVVDGSSRQPLSSVVCDSAQVAVGLGGRSRWILNHGALNSLSNFRVAIYAIK